MKLETELRAGMAAHSEGRLVDAARCCRQVLESDDGIMVGGWFEISTDLVSVMETPPTYQHLGSASSIQENNVANQS
ncbi:hypothetical protein CU669_16115 [Paramagnetospirillum kuznetsovii]|uniref:Uncharacterized protein n=1 Tax=Paramagnetospirillum kuznetsovii TaxID=2053833 RepID=A0A364NUP8_9PROT|nr:hypothetical protein [Paramagnetospirillum kuznetsovii]RAU20798.1 hypothetical protein CU669_16115 [Paramagnetospirillum kuznetsovii]